MLFPVCMKIWWFNSCWTGTFFKSVTRQGTSSQYQYCYLDLVIWYWYTICQLNQFNTNSEAVMLSTSSCHEWGPDISRSRSMRFWNASSLRTVMLLECWYIEQGSTLFYLPSAPSPPTFGFLASLWLLRSKYFPLPVPTRPSSYRFLLSQLLTRAISSKPTKCYEYLGVIFLYCSCQTLV